MQLTMPCRYAAITTFLQETEEYMNKLITTLVQKKLAEQREAAYNAALLDARSTGYTEDVALQMALQAATAAADESELARISENLSGDAQVRPAPLPLRRPLPCSVPLAAMPPVLTAWTRARPVFVCLTGSDLPQCTVMRWCCWRGVL